jgi:hypothetical protein
MKQTNVFATTAPQIYFLTGQSAQKGEKAKKGTHP